VLSSFPFYRQRDAMDCGPACLMMAAAAHGRVSMTKKRLLTLIWVLLFLTYVVYGQSDNLIQNPDFELLNRIRPASWFNIATVDFYENGNLVVSDHVKAKYKDYKSWPNEGKPFSGKYYVGIGGYFDATEVLFQKLQSTLEKGAWYEISMWVRLPTQPNRCGVPMEVIAVYFSDSLLISNHYDGYKGTPPYPYTALRSKDSKLLDVPQWIRVSANYLAKGGEQFLHIGNFYDANEAYTNLNDTTSTGVATSESAKGCYYFYYDSIALRKINPVSGFSMRFNLQFNQGLSTIQGYPEEELSSLLAMLESYPDITVTVEGHTDDVGTESDNYNLSLARCQSVNKLLLEKGVDKNRIRIKAYGELKPLVANDSDKNRALNRRVHIVVN
jgi:outer membrane protein OmpA-like peptidoglycan-associated protein